MVKKQCGAEPNIRQYKTGTHARGDDQSLFSDLPAADPTDSKLILRLKVIPRSKVTSRSKT